ncbi:MULTISPECIES: tagaturonate reductase [Flavobacteriaceae]|uniref:tagaturonate reductase n=1 Tax=Flavobacteriaceae TaxID=49546 RepID=UPI001492FCD8|nr:MULTISPECIES: tagaturonate reductase [Allomuricauda]MDC6365907.1 tagaturonate reductase [Muricauda sp. AC10]
MDLLNRSTQTLPTKRPIKIVQFGEGNFLRAFVDYAFYELNAKSDLNAGIAVIQPIDRGLVSMLNEQDGLYTLFSKGVMDGEEIIEKHLVDTIVKGIDPYAGFDDYMALAKEEELEFIISNTTEAGIAFDENDTVTMQPPNSFPAKLTVLLYERFRYFKGAHDKGLTIIPCELINYNADTLRSIILKYAQLWNLGNEFTEWVDTANSFHNTLVDRIVPGYPKDEIEAYNAQLDYKDNLIVTSEVFFLWVIEGDEALKIKLPFHKTDLDVKIVEDMQPYRTRKVRILNGAHTSMVPFSMLFGNETVKQTVDNGFTGKFVSDAIFEEIIPTLELDRQELEDFAHAILDRFRNPFIKHKLTSIALNSISKFKVRVLPSLLQYQKEKGMLPLRLTFALACLIRFYRGEWNNVQLPVNDDPSIMEYFNKVWSKKNVDGVVSEVLSNEKFWDADLTKVAGLENTVAKALGLIEEKGIEKGFEAYQTGLFV